MTGLQIFAFILLPIIVAALGWLAAFAFAPPRAPKKPDEPSLPGAPRHRL